MGASAPLAQTLIPDNMDNSLSYSVLNYLKRLKNQAKIEFDRLCNEVISKQVAASSLTKSLSNCLTSNVVTEGVRVVPKTPLKKDLVGFNILKVDFSHHKLPCQSLCVCFVGVPSLVARQIYGSP